MTASAAKWIFAGGLTLWAIVRYPFLRRAWRDPVASSLRGPRERFLLFAAAAGLFAVPVLYITTGFPRTADHSFSPTLAWLGTAAFLLAIWLFYRAHHDLGRNFSDSLDLRVDHTLVTTGIYRAVRHPMYLGFWLWSLAQILLLPNWVAGFAGLAGFAALFFGRLKCEEQMMLDRFGDDYRDYASRTARMVPWIY
jgi:protein-S-isoprenylcysteine O-methyltransferase Ste14